MTVFLAPFVFLLSVNTFQCTPSKFRTNVHIRSVISYTISCVLSTETIFALLQAYRLIRDVVDEESEIHKVAQFTVQDLHLRPNKRTVVLFR